MKNILLICLLSIACVEMQAQTYHPLLTDSVRWEFAMGYGLGGGTVSIRSTGDTIVQGISYKKILVPMYNPNDDRYLLREDTALKKVFLRDIKPSGDVDSLEMLAYDFNLVKGDTFSIGYQDSFGRYYVDTTYILSTLAGPRKLISLVRTYQTGGWVDFNRTQWLEGVGEVRYPHSWFAPCFYHWYGREVSFPLCAFQNGQKIYSTTIGAGSTCFYQWADGVLETSPLAAIEVYPNPTSDYIHLDASTNDQSIFYKLRNMYGAIVRTGDVKAHCTIDVNDLPLGLYLLELSAGNERKVMKVLKR